MKIGFAGQRIMGIKDCQMRKLSIFDEGAKIATITVTSNGSLFISARSSREWKEMDRLVSGHDVGPDNDKFLEHVVKRAHNYDYNTELIEE